MEMEKTVLSSSNNRFNFKKYYDTNKEFREKHKEYMKDKITCTCGLEITRNNKTNHLKSLKHKEKLELNEKDKLVKDKTIERNELNELIEKLTILLSNQKNNEINNALMI